MEIFIFSIIILFIVTLVKAQSKNNKRYKKKFNKINEKSYNYNNKPRVAKSKEYKQKLKDMETKAFTNLHVENEKIFKEKKKKTYAETMKENKEKGDNYEKYLIEHFNKLGYIVVEHGLDRGKKDRGIDIILRGNKENLFIQAKNWKANGKLIDHTIVKAFVGEVAFYIEDNPAFSLSAVKRLFITSNDVLDNGAKYFINEHKAKIEYFVMPMPN